MTSPGHGEIGGIENETFDFSQLEEYINDDSENNIYFHDALVTPNELRAVDKTHYSRTRDNPAGDAEATSIRGHSALVHPCIPRHDPQQKSVDVSTTFTKPHHLPDSPPDSGSEPPFSPANEVTKGSPFCADPKQLRCPPIDLHHQHHLAEMSEDASMKHPYLGYVLPSKHLPDSSSSTSPTSTSSSPHHQNGGPRHRSPVPSSPVPIHAAHSTSMPVLAGQMIPQPLLSPYACNSLQQQLMAGSGTHVSALYPGEDFMYDGVSSNPVSSTTPGAKKRKFPDSPKQQKGHLLHANGVQVKTEPTAPSPDPTTTVLPSSEEEYNFDLNSADANALFVDSSYQCIRFQPFQQSTWAQLLDEDMKEISCPHFRVDADKGFNFSNADESFVCQKKNHFQVTVHVQPSADAMYVRTPEGATRQIERFALHFHGVKMESPTQAIKVEQSQSDRSKRPFHPVPLEMVVDQLTKTTVGRLHFSETTSNNMRKKGKPNPDQRFFFLVVSLCAHVVGDSAPLTVVAHSSEKIIVRASNPGQFENDMELSWQKGQTADSIFHNGRVGINTDRPEESLVVHGNVKITGHILQPSDARAKYHIHELDTREQLRNVASLRIVRYRYLPEFGEHLGIGREVQDTGVVAQEVQAVIPEAVIDAGDLVLRDGHLIEKLLVVNKERIFMENVGAVKELCKVTDNLENRIDELERINRKLNTMKRKDSFKSTGTDLSRISSVCSSLSYSPDKSHRCRHACGKKRPGRGTGSWSSHFIQSTIIVLVVIMACCLLALATLYIMEWQSRHDKFFRGPVVIQVKSSSYLRNSTLPIQEKFSVLSTLFPTSRQSPGEDPRKTVHVSTATTRSTEETTASGETFPVSEECAHEEDCPVYCCGEEEEEDPELKQHVDRKRGDGDFPARGAELEIPKKRDSGIWKQHSNFHHRLQKRMVVSEEVGENSNSFKPDEFSNISLQLLELNVTLVAENCTKDRPDDSALEYVHCTVLLSRHFPRLSVTLHISTKDSETVVEKCGAEQFSSCLGKTAQRELNSHSHSVSRRDFIPQSRTWQLQVGTHFRSSFRFRVATSVLPHTQAICSLTSSSQAFIEYVLTFQRRCDK